MWPFLSARNKRLYLRLRPLIENKEEESYLAANVAAGSGTITVANINKFAVNKILIIGELGDETTEFIKTHASTPPSGSTVTLASNLVFAHPANAPVYVVEYDQVHFSHSTTPTGSKTDLTTTLGSGLVALEADELEMVYRETEFTSGYYFARFKNSIGGNFSEYTDPVPYSGFPINTVGYIVDKCLKDQSSEFNDRIDFQWFCDEINACLKQIQGKLKRMNKFQSLNTIIGQTSGGMYRIIMPADIYDNMSNRSLVGLRIGSGIDLTYVDPIQFEKYLVGRNQTAVATQASVAATSLILEDTDDLDDSGTVDVWVTNVKYTIRYTGITRGTNTLTGIPASGTGSIGVILPVGSLIYTGAQYGYPDVYTVRNGYIEFANILNERYLYKNIFADYWTVATEVNTELDEIDAERYDMLLSWMQWKLRCQLKNEGKLDLTDGDYILFKESLNDFIRTLPPNIKYPMAPNLNGINYRGTLGWKNRIKRPGRYL